MSTVQHRTRSRIHARTPRFKKYAFLVLLGAVVVSLTAATANVAGAANATQPVVGATTHPIQYWIGCAPSMVTTTNLNYFKQQGFTAVVVVVPDSQTYQTQLTTIKSLNMLPIIDIEMPIWDGGQLQSTPISHFASYFQSLETAGWQYVASEGGRTGDLAYLQNYFKGYVNFNCDQCGLWQEGNPVYTNSFTVANSWESYYTSEWSSIQTGSKQAAALGIQNGLLAGTWANSGGDNQIYANSLSGSGTSYLSMLNWSYANGIGFTSFHVWCGDNPDGLSQYKSLGFPQIVANLQKYYPATTSASLGRATTQPVASAPAVPSTSSNGIARRAGRRRRPSAGFWRQAPLPCLKVQGRSTSLCAAVTTAFGRRLPRMEAPPGPTGPLSAGRLLPAQDQRPPHRAVVSTSLYKARTAPCIKKRGTARRGPAGNPSAGP
jgi:hypothetical protein